MSIGVPVPRKGEVSFAWFNRYAGVMIRTPSKTLIVDPTDVDPRAFATADVVLITHEHYDHLDPAIVRDVQSRTKCTVIADITSAKRLKKVVEPGKLREVKAGDEVELDGIRILIKGCNHPAATPVTFLIVSEDGVKVYHTADSLPFPEMKRIGEEDKPDVTFCTVGIAPRASPSAGVEIAKLTKPKVAIPYHTDVKGDLSRFAELLIKEAPGIRCMIVERHKAYKYP